MRITVAPTIAGAQALLHARSATGRNSICCPTVTRRSFRNRGGITDLFEDVAGHNLGRIDSRPDRVMLCGSPDMPARMTMLLCENHFEGSSSAP